MAINVQRKDIAQIPLSVRATGKRAREFTKRHGEAEEAWQSRILKKLQDILETFQVFPAVGDELEVEDGEKYIVKERYFHVVRDEHGLEMVLEMSHDSTEPATGGPGQ